MVKKNKIWVIIPVYKRFKYLPNLITIFSKNPIIKTLIIYHGCDKESVNILRKQLTNTNNLKILEAQNTKNMWWTGAVNFGIEYVLNHAKIDDRILLINDDVIIDDNYVFGIINCKSDEVIYGSHIIEKNNNMKKINCGIEFNRESLTFQPIDTHEKYKCNSKFQRSNMKTLSGKGTLIPIKIIKQIGLFDEVNFPHYGSDYEYFKRCSDKGIQLVISNHLYLFDAELDGWQNTKYRIFKTLDKKSNFSLQVQLKLFIIFTKSKKLILKKIIKKIKL